MSAETREQALARLRPWVERARDFSGWDFSDLGVRGLEPGPPWDYEETVSEFAASARAVLDLGTGGGERLSGMRDALPERVVATEQWYANAPIAYRRLAPLGVHVLRARSDAPTLPFADGTFDLVIDRHEALEPAEIARVLQPGGVCVTQQVGRHEWDEMRRHFPRMTEWEDHRTTYTSAFEDFGMTVESSEHERKVAYPSLGEVVYMLSVTPWTIPDFDVEADLDALLALEAECATDDGLVLSECRYLLAARKPVYGRSS